MKIMIVGDWRWERYEYFFAEALRRLGHDIHPVPLQPFFSGKLGSMSHALPVPSVRMHKINRFILDQASNVQPDIAIFWRVTHAFPFTITKIRKKDIITVSYNNDDPFGPKAHANAPWHHHFKWFWYKRCLPKFDYNFFYRSINVKEAKKHKARNCQLLLPYFDPKSIPPHIPFRERHGIIFAGHYEPDGREQYIQALDSGCYDFKLYGDKYWTENVLGKAYKNLMPINWLGREEYFEKLRQTRIAIVFLSKLNRDKYTRRCFEIPASGALMLSERTDELAALFEPDKEACFFSSVEEFLDKLDWLIANPEQCEKIAAAGHKKVIEDGHDIDTRCKNFIEAITR